MTNITAVKQFAFRADLDDLAVSDIYIRYICRCGLEPVWFDDGTQAFEYNIQNRGKWRNIKLLPKCYEKVMT